MGRTNPQPESLTPLTIGQLAKQFGVTTRALRYYEEYGLIAPIGRSEGRYRLYDGQLAPKRINAIIALQSLGYSLSDIADMLGSSVQPNSTKMEQLSATRQRLSKQQQQLGDKLILLTDIKSQVDNRLTLLDTVCTPCVTRQPETPCTPTCKHHHVHED